MGGGAAPLDGQLIIALRQFTAASIYGPKGRGQRHTARRGTRRGVESSRRTAGVPDVDLREDAGVGLAGVRTDGGGDEPPRKPATIG